VNATNEKFLGRGNEINEMVNKAAPQLEGTSRVQYAQAEVTKAYPVKLSSSSPLRVGEEDQVSSHDFDEL